MFLLICCLRFPKDPKQRKKWLDFVNIAGWYPKRHHRVCSDHFDEKDFYIIGNKKMLSAYALPKHLDVVCLNSVVIFYKCLAKLADVIPYVFKILPIHLYFTINELLVLVTHFNQHQRESVNKAGQYK